MVWPNILNGDDTPLCLHLREYKDTTGNDLFFKAKPKRVFSGPEKFHIYSRRGGNMNSGVSFLLVYDYFMTHCPMRTVIKLSHLQVMNTVSRLPTGSTGGGGVLPRFHRHLLITGKAMSFIS